MSLIETIVVLAVVATLAAIALPTLRGVRDRAWDAKSLSNARTHTLNMLAYTSDWRGMFPYFAEPREGTTLLEGGGFSVEVEYFSLYAFWHLPMIDGYYGGSVDPALFHSPFEKGSGAITRYGYSMSFIADPSFWNPATRTYTFDQLRPTGGHEVVWPAEKGLITDTTPLFPPLAEISRNALYTPVGFVDGSTRNALLHDLTLPYPNGNGFWLGGVLFGVRIIHTIDGVRGRDLR